MQKEQFGAYYKQDLPTNPLNGVIDLRMLNKTTLSTSDIQKILDSAETASATQTFNCMALIGPSGCGKVFFSLI